MRCCPRPLPHLFPAPPNVLISVLVVSQTVADLIRTCLGPRSMLKMLLDPMGGIVLTNDGNAILRECDVTHPAAKSMMELSRTQDEEVGDGTTSVIILGLSGLGLSMGPWGQERNGPVPNTHPPPLLRSARVGRLLRSARVWRCFILARVLGHFSAGEMLSVAMPFLEREIHPTVIIAAFNRALEDGLKIMDQIALKIDTSSRKEMLSIIKSSLGTKLVRCVSIRPPTRLNPP